MLLDSKSQFDLTVASHFVNSIPSSIPPGRLRDVERLLHSEAYAERMTVEWLDVARLC